MKLLLILLFLGILPALLVGQSKERLVGTGPSFNVPVGLQLYSLRDQFKNDVPGTLDQVEAFGIKYVETAGTYGVPAEKFRALLDERGLRAVSGHFPYEQCRDNVDSIAAEAKTLGLEYVGCAWIPHKEPFDEKACREAAGVFNRASQVSSSSVAWCSRC